MTNNGAILHLSISWTAQAEHDTGLKKPTREPARSDACALLSLLSPPPQHPKMTTPDRSTPSLLDIPQGDLIAYAVPAICASLPHLLPRTPWLTWSPDLSTAPVAAFIANTGLFSSAVPVSAVAPTSPHGCRLGPAGRSSHVRRRVVLEVHRRARRALLPRRVPALGRRFDLRADSRPRRQVHQQGSVAHRLLQR